MSLSISGHGYLLIGGLVLVGAGLLIISLIFNLRVAHSVRNDARHREKLHEYYRNTFSQLGVILIGIGVSLFMFFFQQNYQDTRRREGELNQVLARLAVRVARGAPLMEAIAEYDPLLDQGGPYVRPEDGGDNGAVRTAGRELARQVADILLIERDVDLQGFGVMNVSGDLESSVVGSELDPVLWFNIVRDESEIQYATTQLGFDLKDLHEAIGDDPVDVAIADPGKQTKIKQETLDVLYDADLLRQRSRRLLGRACWMFSKGTGFVALRPVAELEADSKSHREWMDRLEPFLTKLKSGSTDCFELLRYERAQ
jgi:hypothetical protein